MFTGIIQAKAELTKIKKDQYSFKLNKKIKLKNGDSISIDGICSTVINAKGRKFVVQYMPETLHIVKQFKIGSTYNIEPSLKLNQAFSGHFVTGHIDCVGVVIKFNKKNILEIKYPKKFRKFIVYKGSITINGVSLTVIDNLATSLIDYTLKETNLGSLKKEDLVNLEFDILAKYAFNLKFK